MTKVTAARPPNRIVEYARETRAELRKVVWPTREVAINLTAVVLFVTMLMTVILGGMDLIFGQILTFLLGLGEA